MIQGYGLAAAPMMVAIWLLCGVFAAAISGAARPQSLLGGRPVALTAGLCGGFLGGAGVRLAAGHSPPASVTSVYGAAVGAILLLDLIGVTSDSCAAANRRQWCSWLWVVSQPRPHLR